MPTYNFIDRTGQKFGRLTVTSRAPNKNGRTMWECECTCGSTVVIRGEHLRNKASTSCGCYSKESHTKHGHTKHGEQPTTPEYHVWVAMRQRCCSPKHRDYPNYGGRGITICDRWKESFQSFLDDVGFKPGSSLSIDRINNDGNYEPSNVKWSTSREQVINRRNSILYTIDGKSECLKYWASHFRKDYSKSRQIHKDGGDVVAFLTG